ncbi:MAG: hypothetical protein Q9160_008545 [Pyrenula sp. 1 TL-2023]
MGAKRRTFGGRSVRRRLPLEEALKHNPYTEDFEELLSDINQHIHFSVRVMMRLRNISCLPLKGYRSRIVRQGLQESVIWVRSKTQGMSTSTVFPGKIGEDVVAQAHIISEDNVIDEEMHLLDEWINQWENEREQPILSELSKKPKSAKVRRKDAQSLADFIRPLLKEAKQANVHYRGFTDLSGSSSSPGPSKTLRFAINMMKDMGFQGENERVRFEVQRAREKAASTNRPAPPMPGFAATTSRAEQLSTVEQEDESRTGASEAGQQRHTSLQEDEAGLSAAPADNNFVAEKLYSLEAFQEQERKQFGHFIDSALPNEDEEKWIEDSDEWVTSDNET